MLEVFLNRRSVRNYLGKEVEEEKLNAILGAALLAPSAVDRKEVELFVIKDKKKMKKFEGVTKWSEFADNAPVLVIVGCDETKAKRWVEDCSVAATYLWLETANQGLGTCWIQIREGTTDDGSDPEETVRKILGLGSNYRILCMFPIGYPAGQPRAYTEHDINRSRIRQV